MFPKLFLTMAACLLATSVGTAQVANGVPASYPVASPPAVVPALPAATSPQLDLLHQKIAQRDQLQREIDQLIVATQTPQTIELYFELLEIDVAAAHQVGINLSTITPQQLEELRRAGATKTLFSPKFMTPSGEQLNSQVGEEKKVQCRADSLGNNRVRMDIHFAAKSDAEASDSEASSESLPGTTLTFHRSLEANFGEPQILPGVHLKRTQTRRGALGRATETTKTQAMLVVCAEPILPHTAGVVPAALTPR